MNHTTEKERWLLAAVLAGAAYLAIGVGFAEFARHAATREMRLFWRLAAWAGSFVVLALHFAHETVRCRRPPRRAAFHVAAGVALGAFGLAGWINAHASASARSPLAPLALIVFPLATGIPAFLGAWAAAAVMARLRADRAA